jgi:hypothetical protein
MDFAYIKTGKNLNAEEQPPLKKNEPEILLF